MSFESPEAALEDYEAAKLRWETFESGDERFPFPRKNYKYVARIVSNEADIDAAISRARRYYDMLPMWLLRMEAYRNLAEQLAPDKAAVLAKAVYEQSLPHLQDAPVRIGTWNHGPETEYGTLSVDNVLDMLSWAAVVSTEESYVVQHQAYLKSQLANDLLAKGENPESIPGQVDYFTDSFEALLHPERACVMRRAAQGGLSPDEVARRYAGCLVCGSGFWIEDGTLGTQIGNGCTYAAD